MKYFSHQEAESLIPKLKIVMESAFRLKLAAERKLKQFKRLEKNPEAKAVDVLIARTQIEFLIGQTKLELQSIAKMGAVPKGLEPALVDFPARINGKEIYYCWKHGEDRISYYHGLEEGYKGRKPISLAAILQPKN